MKNQIRKTLIAAAAICSLLAPAVHACTGIRLIAEDGAARAHDKDEHGNILADYTIWTSANDLKAKRFYFRTYENSQIRMVDLMKMKIDGKDMVKISMKGGESIKSLNP